MAFDVALDWISSKVNQRIFFDVYAKELKEVKIALKNCSEVIREYEAEDQKPKREPFKSPFPRLHSQRIRTTDESARKAGLRCH